MAINPTDRIFFDGKECRDVFFDGHLHQEAWMEHDGALECVWRKGGKAPDAICMQMQWHLGTTYMPDALVAYYKKPDGSWSYSVTRDEIQGHTPKVMELHSYSVQNMCETPTFVGMWQVRSNVLAGLGVISFDGFNWHSIGYTPQCGDLTDYNAQAVDGGLLLGGQFTDPDYFDVKFLKIEKDGIGVNLTLSNIDQLAGRWQMYPCRYVKNGMMLRKLFWNSYSRTWQPKEWCSYIIGSGLYHISNIYDGNSSSYPLWISERNGIYCMMLHENNQEHPFYKSTDLKNWALVCEPRLDGWLGQSYCYDANVKKHYFGLGSYTGYWQVVCDEDFTNFTIGARSTHLNLQNGYYIFLGDHMPTMSGTRLNRLLHGPRRFSKVYKNGKWIDEQYHFCEKVRNEGSDRFQIILPADLINFDPDKVELLSRYDVGGGFPEKWNNPPFTPRFIS